MLKLSTKGRYGVRAMSELALAWGQGPVLMGTIAERQGFSRKYLHALLTSLKEAGLVESIRGARGGYLLAKPPEQIRLDQIVIALEGPLAVVHCVREDGRCARAEECIVQDLWRTLSAKLVEVLSAQTLEDLVKDYRS